MLQVIRLLAVALCTCGWLASSEAATGPLRVATLSDYPPYAFLGPDGKPRGWMPDLWAEWSRHTGIAVQLIPSSWPEAVARFESGGSDVLDCIAVTPERAQRMDFIPPLLHVEAHVFIERPWHDAADPGLLRSLRGLLVGVVDRDDAALRLASADPALKLHTYPSLIALLDAAESGQVRAFAADTAAVYHHLVRRGADGRFARSTEALSRLPLSVALQRGSALGVDRVQAGFAAIQPSTLREISARWLPPPASPPPWWTRWEVLIPLIALLLAGLALLVTQTWNRNLRRRVELAVVNERQAQSRLAQAERLDALGRLSAGVAHDVNNTIAIVVGTVEMLRRELSAKPDADRLAASCIDACRHAGETMRQLLRFARRGSGELVAIDLLSLIDGVIALVRPSLRGQVVISWTPPPGNWCVLADQGEIQHAIINLLLNARDAQSGRPGGITISLRQGDPLSGPPLVASAQAPPAPAIAIEVADQGCGIPPEVLPRIFEPFFTTKGVEVGTGLGLPAVEGIARRHGGAVALESTAGQGTRVVIWLPLAP